MIVIETSKSLKEAADWFQSEYDRLKKMSIDCPPYAEWAAAIRSVVIPAPLGSDETVAKVKQWIECSNCGAKATITYESTAGVLPVALHCKCGTVTPYKKGSDDDPPK